MLTLFYVRGIIQVPRVINGSDDDILRLGLLDFWTLSTMQRLTIALSIGPTQCLRTISPEEGDRASLRKHSFIYEYNAVGEIQKANHPNFQGPSVCCNATEHVWAID